MTDESLAASGGDAGRPVLLAVAGYDPAGGGGVLADVRAARLCGVRAVAAVTAVTAQNTRSMTRIQAVEVGVLREQLALLQADFAIGAVKIGMLARAELVPVVADFLRSLPDGVPVVWDPVLAASAGMPLFDGPLEAFAPLWHRCTLVTPNLPELAQLAGIAGKTVQFRESAARRLFERGARAVLVKGGHADGGRITDTLHQPHRPVVEFSSPRWPWGKIRGTGCFLSSATACGLMQGRDLAQAVQQARILLQSAAQNVWRPAPGAPGLFPDVPAFEEGEP